MKDHQIRELVNDLRDIAIEYHGTQQLRERIARSVRAAMLQGADGNSPVIPDAYEIKSFGFFSAVAGDDDLILQIEEFSFDSGRLSQSDIDDFVPRLALQAIINKLQEHCDKLGNRPLDNVLSGLGREE